MYTFSPLTHVFVSRTIKISHVTRVRAVPDHSVVAPTHYDTQNNAIRAVVPLKIYAGKQDTAGFVLGPSKGAAALEAALDCGLEPAAWARTAVYEAIAGNAPSTIRSAISSLRGWTAFSDTALEANGRRLLPRSRDSWRGIACSNERKPSVIMSVIYAQAA